MARPREFDEETVLDAATEAFWGRGYEATSTRDLTSRTGITASSMYMAFGNKRDLFRLSLNKYLERTLHEKLARLEAAEDPALAITTFFYEIIERSLGDEQRRGCLMVNSIFESSAGDESLKEDIGRELRLVEQFFVGRLAAAQRARTLQTSAAVEDIARHLLSVLLGVRVLARVRPEAALLTGAVGEALRASGLPPLPPRPAK